MLKLTTICVLYCNALTKAIIATDEAFKTVKAILAKCSSSPYINLSDSDVTSIIPDSNDFVNVIASTRSHIFDNAVSTLSNAIRKVPKPKSLTMMMPSAKIEEDDDEETNQRTELNLDFFTKVFLPYFDQDHETVVENTYPLREWLCHNYLLPHPKREDKAELANASELDVRQVTDWFTNMRSRVWKPSMEQLMEEILIERETAVKHGMKQRNRTSTKPTAQDDVKANKLTSKGKERASTSGHAK